MQEGGGEMITSVPKPLIRSWEFIVLDVPCPATSPAVPSLVCPCPAPSLAWQFLAPLLGHPMSYQQRLRMWLGAPLVLCCVSRRVLLPAEAAPCCSGDRLSSPTAAAALQVPIACCPAPAAPVASMQMTSVVSLIFSLLKWLSCFTQCSSWEFFQVFSHSCQAFVYSQSH